MVLRILGSSADYDRHKRGRKKEDPKELSVSFSAELSRGGSVLWPPSSSFYLPLEEIFVKHHTLHAALRY